MDNNDEFWMGLALKEAEAAALRGEVPVGAIVVKDGAVLSTGQNSRETAQNPLGHAELMALEGASQKLGAWRLLDCTLYVTLEPCVMCAGALVQSRVSRVVYGATDPKGGGVKSLYQICEDPRLNHRLQVQGGVLEKTCGEMLTEFFRQKRKAQG